tara:strand:- start:63 stop:722 length:660 start_codon:yes stop_codon:yes gene_type:complete
MKFEFIYDPVPLIIIRDFFTNDENKEILAEAVGNEKHFVSALTNKSIYPEFRSNKAAYYDVIYEKDRSGSKLLSLIDGSFSNNDELKSVLNTASYPIHKFRNSNYHATQVSRYGDDGQQFKYHIDAMEGTERQLTMVYYFHEEPKKYKGGEISFTRSPISMGVPMDKNAKPMVIKPENNMAVIFGALTAHTVYPTTSPKIFSQGRFSVNCWIGRKWGLV